MGLAFAAIAVFGLFYAAQYRAMLIFFTLVLLLTFWISPAKASRRVMTTIIISTISVITLLVVATAFPNLKLLKVFDLLEDTTPLAQSGKITAVQNAATMYVDMPHTAFVGSGPGTYSSRAFVTFAMKNVPGKEDAASPLAASLMGSHQYATDVGSKYILSIPNTSIQGGNTAASWQSSYTSLAAEVGTLGFLVYMAAYLSAMVFSYRRLVASAKAHDALGVRLGFVCFGGILLLLIQALFDNWLETTRVTIPLWTLIGALYALKTADENRPHAVALAPTSDDSRARSRPR